MVNTHSPRPSIPTRRLAVLTLLLHPLLLAANPACHDPGNRLRDLPPDGAELPILQITQAAHSHETAALQFVVRDAAAYSRLQLVDVPVDFNSEMLLVITLGQVPSDQFQVRIDRVWREGRRLKVRSSVQRPPPGAPIVMASPFCIVVVPRCDLSVDGFLPEPPTRARSWEQSPPPRGI